MDRKIKNIMTFVFTFVFITFIGLGATEVRADFVGDAANWYSQGGDKIESMDISEIVKIVNVAGTAVIAIVTVVLGIKYMLGSASGKSEVKEQMISLLVACILFFGWSNLSGILISGATFNPDSGTYGNVGGSTQLFIFKDTSDITKIFANIFAIVMFIARIVAVVVTMVIGVKYILVELM